MKQKDKDELLELTVYEYFVEHRKIPLRYSGNFPCISVGRPKNPALLPIEVVFQYNKVSYQLLYYDAFLMFSSFLSSLALYTAFFTTLHEGSYEFAENFTCGKISPKS